MLRSLAGRVSARADVVAICGAVDPESGDVLVVAQRGEGAAAFDCGAWAEGRRRQGRWSWRRATGASRGAAEARLARGRLRDLGERSAGGQRGRSRDWRSRATTGDETSRRVAAEPSSRSKSSKTLLPRRPRCSTLVAWCGRRPPWAREWLRRGRPATNGSPSVKMHDRQSPRDQERRHRGRRFGPCKRREATWSRGDYADALKWIRRAAEAASEAEKDDRAALELAKAAADAVASLLAERVRG